MKQLTVVSPFLFIEGTGSLDRINDFDKNTAGASKLDQSFAHNSSLAVNISALQLFLRLAMYLDVIEKISRN